LALFHAVFTQPSYLHFVAVVAGTVLGFRRRTVAGMVAAAGLSGLHHAGFNRFFSQAVWQMDAIWRVWAPLVIGMLPRDSIIYLAGDDTVSRKTGGKIYAVGLFHDNRPSASKSSSLRWGHNWVVLGIIVPLSGIGWDGHFVAVPVWVSLYKKKALCEQEAKKGRDVAFKKKPELLNEMVWQFMEYVPEGREVWLLVDGGYSTKQVVQNLPGGVEVFGRARSDAQIYDFPPKRMATGVLGVPSRKAIGSPRRSSGWIRRRGIGRRSAPSVVIRLSSRRWNAFGGTWRRSVR